MTKVARNWTILLGFITAVLALLTGVLTLEGQRRALVVENEDLRHNAEVNEQNRRATEVRLQQELDGLRMRIAEQRKADECKGHQANISTVDSRFSELMSRHGILLNLLKSCTSGKGEGGNKVACMATVCAGAGYFYGVDCSSVAQEYGALVDDSQRFKQIATQAQCVIGKTAIEQFVAN